MPITIDEILERDRSRAQESEWAELVEELQNGPKLQEIFADDWLIHEHSGSTKYDIIDELIRETDEFTALEATC